MDLSVRALARTWLFAEHSQQFLEKLSLLQVTDLAGGKVERTFPDFAVVQHPNGTISQKFADGSVAVHFTNGDVKQTRPEGLTSGLNFTTRFADF